MVVRFGSTIAMGLMLWLGACSNGNHAPACAKDSECDDGAFCNGAEVCDATGNCAAGTPMEVDDGIGCTDDVCDDDLGMVVNTPNDSVCSDDLFCNGAETCDAINGCIAGPPPATQLTLSQSTNSTTIIASNSLACNDGESSYYRVFDLSATGLDCPFDVTSIDFAIQEANATGATQPVTVRIHTLNGPLLPANLTEVASTTIDVADQIRTIVNVPLAATVNTSGTMVVEVLTPDHNGAGNLFFFGSNNLGQSNPAFLRAPDCGVTEPTDLAVLAPDMHIVMTVNGASATLP